MKRFKEISKKIVSIKTFAKRNFLDDEEKGDGVSSKQAPKRSREALLMEALIDPENTEMKVLYQLSVALLEEAGSVTSGGTPALYYAVALMDWIAYHNEMKAAEELSAEAPAGGGMLGLMGASQKNIPSAAANAPSIFSPATTLRWAQAHFEVWTRKGVAAEEIHLHRARKLFEQAFKRDPELMTAATQFSYCKVLALIGDMEAASAVALKILSSYEHDAEYPTYLFYTGGLFKAMNQHEKANNYFFEASQVGPPKLFTKLEMMMIISRTIEESTADDDAEEDDAFKMVHAHMKLEGLIDEDLEYDEWISHSDTWLALGDKCAMHHMFSLATDLYGLGIMKDTEAFRKPMLWLRFAKSCKRCGRSADGLLAVKQALTYDPFNPQLLRTQNFWSSSSSAFTDLTRAPLADLLHKVPKELDREHLAITRTQAILKGVMERRGMNLGVGNRRDITRRMTARIGVMLHSTKNGVTTSHPVLLTVRPAWSGLITNIRVFDLQNNHLGAIPLRTPFAPMKETGVPRKLNLSLSCHKVTLKVRAASLLGTASGSDDDEEEVMVNNRLIYRKKVPVMIEETVTELKFKFTDLLTGQYTCRRMKLTLDEMIPAGNEAIFIAGGEAFGVKEFTPSEYNGAENIDSRDMSFDDRPASATAESSTAGKFTAPPFQSRTSGGTTGSGKAFMTRTNSVTRPETAAAKKSVVRRMSVLDTQPTLPTVTETNIESAEILRQGFRFKGLFYMVRIINDFDITQVTMLQVRSNKVFVFIMTREHIDRTHNITRRLSLLMEILEANPLVTPLLAGQKGLRADEAAMVENPCMCQGKHCFVNLLPRSEGATLILLDPNSLPIIGSGFEVMEHEGVLLDARPTSLKKYASVRSLVVGSMKRMPSRRFSMSSRSFRNNAIDEFLGGNLNPPPVEEPEPEEDTFDAAPPMLGQRKALSTIPSRRHMPGEEDLDPDDGEDDEGRARSSMEDSFMRPLEELLPPAKRPISTASSDSEEGDAFDLAPLPTITPKTGAVQVATSSKMKKKPAARVPAAKVRAAAKKNMNEGGTFEDALAAAAELQKKMAEFDIQQRSSKSNKVSWAAWEAEKEEEQRLQEAGQLPPTRFMVEDAGAAGAAEDETPVASGKSASDFLEADNEEGFLKAIVDVPWIEELGSIEVVEYVLQDLMGAMLRATVAYIADQYLKLPIFQSVADEAVAKGTENALLYLLDEEREMGENVVAEVEDTVLDEIFDDAVDDIADERISKLNLMAFKLAVAEKAEAENRAKNKNKKPVVIHASKPTVMASPAPAKPAHPAPNLTIIVPEPEKEEPAVPRVADVAFSQPYRAAPDSPVSAVPVKYNVQKIISVKPTVDKHSSRPYSKRDNLIPVLGAANVNKKRHNPEYLLAAQVYRPPEHMGRRSPQSSIYTGTFSRSDVFATDNDPDEAAMDHIGGSVKKYNPDRPHSRAHLLHFNTIDPLPVLDGDFSDAFSKELSQLTDPAVPSHRVEGLMNALDEWGGPDRSGSPLLTVASITEASQQPFKPGAPSPKRHRSHLSVATDDDGTVSISSENTDGSNPVFQTIQRRKLSLPMDEESVYSVGSASRAGARRSPNKRTMLDIPNYLGDSRDGSSVASVGEESVQSMTSLRSSNGLMSLQPRVDPLQVPPRGSLAREKKRVVKESLDDFRYIGYVKDRPLVHSSHWRGKLFSYLAGLRNADQLRKHVAMLTKATKVSLTREETVCALADTAGSVGEAADKLRSLEFLSEIKLACRSLHIRSMVCMLDGGERVFKETDLDTFGDHGEFDDLSTFSDQLMRKKNNLIGSEVLATLQHVRSVQPRPLNTQKSMPSFSKTAPALQPLGSHNSAPAPAERSSSNQQQTSAPVRSTLTAPTSSKSQKVSFPQDGNNGSSTAPASFESLPEGDEDYGFEDGEHGEPSLQALFQLGREDSLRPMEEDDSSSVTSLSMSLGSTSTRGYPLFESTAIPYPPASVHLLTRTNTNNSTVSVGSTGSNSSAPSVLADQAASMQLTPGIRSILSVPRKNTVMDIMTQSPTVQSKATFVPLKFVSTSGARLSIAEQMGGSPSSKSAKFGFQRAGSAEAVASPEERAQLSAEQQMQQGSTSPDQRAKTMDMFGQWGGRSLQSIRISGDGDGLTPATAPTAGELPPNGRSGLSVSIALTADGYDSGDGATSPLKRMLPKKSSMARMSSFRIGGRIDDLLVEHGDTPLAIMCRRDFLKAQQDEVLLKSDKNYIRKPIEKKIGVRRASMTFDPPVFEDL